MGEKMNAELTIKLKSLINEKKWTDFLESLPIDEAIPAIFKTVQDMNSIRAVAARASSKAGAGGRGYSFSGIDYINLAMCVTASTKKDA